MASPPALARARLIDVAREAGVDRTVVGRVLLGSGRNIRVSDQTAARVRAAAQRMNYRPNLSARQLKGVSSRLVGVLVTAGMNQASQGRLMATEREAHARGYRFTIGQVHPGGSDLAAYLDDFEARAIEAILYLDTSHAGIDPRLAAMPRVIYSVKPPSPPVRRPWFVELDRAAASRMAVEHLRQRGRRRVGLVMNRLTSHTAAERHRGYCEAAAAQGGDPRQTVWVARPDDQDPLAHLDGALDYLLDQRGCDGLVAGDDRWAVALVKAIRRRGLRVPQDVAVVGFNNHDIATAVEPELTTIDQQHDLFARAMIDLMERCIRGDKVPPAERGIMIPPRLVVRDST